MTTTKQGMSFAKVKQIIAQRVANAIETIAIYETKTRMARESMNQIKQQEGKIAEDTINKRKWKDDHKGSSSQQQNKEPKAIKAHAVRPSTRKEELTALRFRADIAEAENASLRARIKTTEAVEKITRNRERQARVKIEQQLAVVQESQRQDREDFRKLKELVTSQFGRHS
ncbi:hypothetical protein Tco_0716966 [Tanacetum coccineum]